MERGEGGRWKNPHAKKKKKTHLRGNKAGKYFVKNEKKKNKTNRKYIKITYPTNVISGTRGNEN